MIHVLAGLTFWELWHPLSGNGYQFWSGIGSDIGEVAIVGGLIHLARVSTCHQKRCWRLGRHPHGPYRLCRVHHPLVPSDGRITQEHIDQITKEAK